MLSRIVLLLVALAGLATTMFAQTDGCAERLKQRLATLDKHLDLDAEQRDCLRQKAVKFCEQNATSPAKTPAQKQQRRKRMRQALMACLTDTQRQSIREARGKDKAAPAGAKPLGDLIDQVLPLKEVRTIKPNR